MSLLYDSVGIMKKISIFVLIMVITVPLRYGSTNYQYLTIRVLHLILSLKHSLVLDVTRPTLSAEYRAFEDMIRIRPVTEYGPLIDPMIIVKDLRSTSSMNILILKPSQCKITREIFEYGNHTVDAYWVENHQKIFQRYVDRIIVYFHGGGYMLGDIHSYSGFECYLSQIFNITILHVEYRLGPEHLFPAAVDDTVAIYRALLHQNISSSQLLIMGDSAGGGLSLLTVQALLSRQLPVPRGVIVLSPWTDLSGSGESFTQNDEIDLIFTTSEIEWVTSQILSFDYPLSSRKNSLISPLFGSFEGFPPMYVNVGAAELLEDDAKRLVNKAQDAGVNVTFEEGLHLMHVYPVLFSYFPEARNTLDNIHKWIQTIFNQKFNE